MDMGDRCICRDCGSEFFSKIGTSPYRCLTCFTKRKKVLCKKRRDNLFSSDNDQIITCRKCRKKLPISMFGKNIDSSTKKSCLPCDKLVFLRGDIVKSRAAAINSRHVKEEFYRSGAKISPNELVWICTKEWIEAEIKRASSMCSYCSVKLEWGKNLCFDHVVPLSRGGKLDGDNITPSCIDCNSLKGTKTGEEFISFLVEYAERVLSKFNGQ